MFIGVASCLVSTICPPFIGGDIDVFSRSRSALSLCDAPVMRPAVSWRQELIVVSAPGITPLSRDLSSGSSRPADPIAVPRIRHRPSPSCRSSVVSPTDPKLSIIHPTPSISPRPEQIRPALALFPASGPRRSGPEDTCGARVRRAYGDTRADRPISQIAPFPENPVFPKSPQTANPTHEPRLSEPRTFPTPAIPRPIASRNDTQPKRMPNPSQLSLNDTTNAEPTISNTNVAYRYRQCHQSTGTHPNPPPFAHNASRISHACPSQIADIHATCRPIIAQMQSIRQTHTAEQIRGQTPLQATRCAGSHQSPTIPIPNFS